MVPKVSYSMENIMSRVNKTDLSDLKSSAISWALLAVMGRWGACPHKFSVEHDKNPHEPTKVVVKGFVKFRRSNQPFVAEIWMSKSGDRWTPANTTEHRFDGEMLEIDSSDGFHSVNMLADERRRSFNVGFKVANGRYANKA